MKSFDREIIHNYNIPIGLIEKAEQLCHKLNGWDKNSRLLLISHRDGDGLSAVSVLYQALKSLNFSDFHIKILLSPDQEQLSTFINELKPSYVITSDIGTEFTEFLDHEVENYIITDHHPNRNKIYGDNQLNPLEFGLDNENDASGSSTAFLLIFPLFDELFWTSSTGKVILCYSIAGAVSDFQLKPNKNPVAVNKFILDLAIKNEAIEWKKDISIFGRALYPIYLAVHYTNIPGFEDRETSNIIINSQIESKDGEYWKRIVDLEREEKAKLMEIITSRLIEMDIDSPNLIIKDEIIGWVYDLKGLIGFDCTRLNLDDERFTLDSREILHRVNYCCRLGFSDMAVQLLNNKQVTPEIWNQIESFHKNGDMEIANALNLFQRREIPSWSWDERIMLLDFTGHIFYDEAGVIGGVIMKSNKNIQIILSACQKDEEFLKLSIRARDEIWNCIDNSNELSDAKKIFHAIKEEYPTEIRRYGGHRWACSSLVKRSILSKIFEKMKEYYFQLKDPTTNQLIFDKSINI